jgi:hypothetical protein
MSTSASSTYRRTIASVVWPSSFCSVKTSPPARMKRFAPVWRRVCGEQRTPFDAGSAAGLRHHHVNRPPADAVAVACDEERVARSQILHDVSVPSQRLSDGHAERDAAFLPSLAHDPDHPLVEVDVLGAQADQLGDADQGVEKDEQDRSVPDPQPGPLIGDGKQGLQLRVGEGLDDRLRYPGHLEESGDVLGDVTEAVTQPAQGLQDLRVPVHGVGREP